MCGEDNEMLLDTKILGHTARMFWRHAQRCSTLPLSQGIIWAARNLTSELRDEVKTFWIYVFTDARTLTYLEAMARSTTVGEESSQRGGRQDTFHHIDQIFLNAHLIIPICVRLGIRTVFSLEAKVARKHWSLPTLHLATGGPR
jgi:hypothetical protein